MVIRYCEWHVEIMPNDSLKRFLNPYKVNSSQTLNLTNI